MSKESTAQEAARAQSYLRYIDSITGEHICELVYAPHTFVRDAIREGFHGADAVIAAELAYKRHQVNARSIAIAEAKRAHDDYWLACELANTEG